MADPAVGPLYDGPALIRVAIPGVDLGNSAGNLANFGYTEDGAEPVLNGFWRNVPGDQNGGPEGPPIDIQFLGETATIRLVMTKFAVSVATALAARVAAATAGTPAATGTLMFEESKAFRLLISPTNRPLNFPRVVLRGSIEINKGTKFQRWIGEFEAHKDANGVLYNATTTG